VYVKPFPQFAIFFALLVVDEKIRPFFCCKESQLEVRLMARLLAFVCGSVIVAIGFMFSLIKLALALNETGRPAKQF